MTLAERTLEIAASLEGTKESPPGSNRGPMVDEFIRWVGLDPTKGHYPWCAAFVSWCVSHAAMDLGVVPGFKNSAGVWEMAKLNSGLILPAPQPNSVFCHLNPNHTGHAGFIVAPLPQWSFTDISGNSDTKGSRTGGMVCRNLRPAGYAGIWLAIE